MEELGQEQELRSNKDNDFNNVLRNDSETIDTLGFQCSVDNPKDSNDEDVPKKTFLRRVMRFSESDSDTSEVKTPNGEVLELVTTSGPGKSIFPSDDSENDFNINKSLPYKSHAQRNRINPDYDKFDSEDEVSTHNIPIKNKRIRRLNEKFNKNTTAIISDHDERLESGSDSDHAVKNEEQQLRMKNKRNKIKDKFKNLLKTRKGSSPSKDDEVNGTSCNQNTSQSDEEIASIEKIKQKIREKMSFKSSVCDPDTSDEENNQQELVHKQKRERKTKLTSPKPQKISAKQAMENMQKIKSESNRMLREKEVSLPYHRPKALSLKDIMSRSKLAVYSDGKALSIKMNGEQLRQYAIMLEERQKEMLELCKSGSEEEDANENPAEGVSGANDSCPQNVKHIENCGIKETTVNSDEVVKQSFENETDHVNFTEDVTIPEPLRPANCINNNKKLVLNSDENLEQILEDSDTGIKLVYNDSADSTIDENLAADVEMKHGEPGNTNTIISTDNAVKPIVNETETLNKNSITEIVESESHLITLNLETENTDLPHITDNPSKQSKDKCTISNNIMLSDQEMLENTAQSIEEHTATLINNLENDISIDNNKSSEENQGIDEDNEFSDDDMYMEDIDKIIENAEIIKDIEDKVNSQFLIRDKPLNLNPKLTGAPGMVIDLDNDDIAPRKSGIELLKERFTFFSKLKTPEELEREREKKLKPGTQLKKLKQELEEKISEQRSLEWAKRLKEEKRQQIDLNELEGEESDEDDIDKIKAAIEEKGGIEEASEESESEVEEPIEDDIVIKDKPRVKNSMVDDEAEESDCDKTEGEEEQNDGDNEVEENDDDASESGENDDSSESEQEEQTVTKRCRILKAFEDSDEEGANELKEQPVAQIKDAKGTNEAKSGSSIYGASQISSQDEELQLAQRPKSISDDLFTSQESILPSEVKGQAIDVLESEGAFTQTFSILDSCKPLNTDIDLNSSGKTTVDVAQSLNINDVDDLASCPITDSQVLPLPSQIPITQLSQSQPIGEDILALCTGQFYNNQFVSQLEKPLADSQNYDAFDNYISQEEDDTQINESLQKEKDVVIDPKETDDFKKINSTDNSETKKESDKTLVDPKDPKNFIELNMLNRDNIVDENLKSILDELADPDFDSPKFNKFFPGTNNNGDKVHTEIQIKRKLVIDSDDETNEGDVDEPKKRKKLKKKKPEKRALQISDDEEEQSEPEEIEKYASDTEEDNVDRLVEYDSEENEIELQVENPKKKRKMAEFFENEAELTSEDEWVGSGDEDEAGLDRMEREEGDDDTFHQGKLQRELEQIHMRDVLDQDKREVRLIQELLFEDGDLGAGGRQRKFRWNNLGDEEIGTVPDEFADTQEEEFESEEQWRKQRHEREMFLRKLKSKDDPEDSANVSIDRTTIIKANLLSKTMSSIVMEVNSVSVEKTESPAVKKTAKDIPSPKKPFTLLQQSYQGSMLSRGRSALARLAALATPLAADEDKVGTIGPNSRRNFVFATLTPEEKQPKVPKRRAESNPDTPKLVKKLRTEEKNTSRSSLLDHLKI